MCFISHVIFHLFVSTQRDLGWYFNIKMAAQTSGHFFMRFYKPVISLLVELVACMDYLLYDTPLW